ncbi:alpha/beta hydrolase [Mucilaginibacter ginkgonis]|uniref:Alpha/beta hydrolase n=1 Tax=Mucilaginibacter ginkgonis TaxID=2682091 RepID=A0A6I4INK1_9SPHI|nr:alpha/beta hydrolase [Mucilaginibacter ginkgonis]QQL48739.1 alpha/beta hydrolase [Mucilaginibacter ginkgonis]
MKYLFSALLLFTMSVAVYAQQADPIDLYPAGVPNSKSTPASYVEKFENGDWMSRVSKPQLLPFFPAEGKANGTAVVICPGGGYAGLSMVKEGQKVALKLNEIGITAFVLKYRLPSDSIMVDKTIGPLQDAQRAMQMVRQNAAKWHIDPVKVGIMGFSAGGHLASTEGTHYSKAVVPNPDNVNLRPDFMMLIYPVITFGQYAHTGSRDNLLGKNASQKMLDLYSNEKQITKDTPPTFIAHAEDDDVVPVQNALMFYNNLLAANVKAEMHIYQSGGHGFGLNNPKESADWFAELVVWMKANGGVK